MHRDYLQHYTKALAPGVHQYVDRHRNCEDIAMAFMVANTTGAPPEYVRSPSLQDLGQGLFKVGDVPDAVLAAWPAWHTVAVAASVVIPFITHDVRRSKVSARWVGMQLSAQHVSTSLHTCLVGCRSCSDRWLLTVTPGAFA